MKNGRPLPHSAINSVFFLALTLLCIHHNVHVGAQLRRNNAHAVTIGSNQFKQFEWMFRMAKKKNHSCWIIHEVIVYLFNMRQSDCDYLSRLFCAKREKNQTDRISAEYWSVFINTVQPFRYREQANAAHFRSSANICKICVWRFFPHFDGIDNRYELRLFCVEYATYGQRISYAFSNIEKTKETITLGILQFVRLFHVSRNIHWQMNQQLIHPYLHDFFFAQINFVWPAETFRIFKIFAIEIFQLRLCRTVNCSVNHSVVQVII